MSGLFTKPSDSLLVERALDYLAGGPATASALVSHICQQSATPPSLAERMAEALLGGVKEIVRDGEGLWRLATHAERDASGLLAGEAGRRAPGPTRAPARTPAGAPPADASRHVPAPPPVEKAVPSFDEWMAPRRAAAASSATPGDSCDGGAPRAPDERSRNGAPARRGRGSGRQAPLEPVILAGDEDALARMSWVVVDVETTGGNPFSGHRITEVAAVVVRDGRIAEVFETLVNPERSIPPMITQLTNISWEMVRDKPPFRDVAPRLVDVLKGHVFVAHNVSFDWKFVSAEVERATGEQLAGRRLCTVRLARRLLPELPRRTLGHLAAHFDADTHAAAYFAERHPDKIWRHRAAGDAVATAHCLLRMLDRARDHGCTTWGGLDTLLSGGTSRARLRRSALALPRPVDRDTTA